MKRKLIVGICLLLVVALFSSGCGRKNEAARIDLEYDFAEGEYGWVGDFTDLPVNYEEDIYELEFGYKERPGEVGTGRALMLSGSNRSDDLFMFIKKQLGQAEGLQPDTTYNIIIEVEFATDAPAGAFGIGGPPGEAVFVKVGAAQEEPVPVEKDGEWRLNVDKGAQSEGGQNAIVVGDATKPEDEDFEVYELKTLANSAEPLAITTDSEGNLWVFVGTDSGFEGKTTLYYTQVNLTLTEAN